MPTSGRAAVPGEASAEPRRGRPERGAPRRAAAGCVPPRHFDLGARRLVTVGEDGTASIWEMDSGRRLHTFRVNSNVTAVTFDRRGRRLATGSADGAVTVWDSAT